MPMEVTLSSSISASGPSMSHRVVLIVDDEPMIRSLIAESLVDAGCGVLEAESAEEAIEVLDGRNDVTNLITDVKMPGSMDGIDLARIVASRWTQVSLLVMSGHAASNDPRLPARAGFLRKPFGSSALLNKVLEH